MIATGPYCLISVEGQYADKLKYKSLNLHLIPGFNPTHHLQFCGVVVGLPVIPPFDEAHDGSKMIHKMIEPIIKEGDKAYFRYINNDGDVNIIEGETRVVRVPYRDIICIVREGEIIPVGEWILGEKIMEQKTALNGLEVDFSNGYYLNRAKVQYVSTFIGEDALVVAGDTVQGRSINFENNIEGKDYYCFRPDQLDLILE